MSDYIQDPSEFHPAEQKNCGLATLSLCLGICSYVLCLWFVAALPGVITGHIARGRIRESNGRLTGDGRAVAGLVLSYINLALHVLIVPIGLIAAIAIPNLLQSRIAANEGSTIAVLRTISSAQATFVALDILDEDGDGTADYGTLDDLSSAGLIDQLLASGTKNGYIFSIDTIPSGHEKPSYRLTAVPLTPGQTGWRGFSVDETGIIRMSDDGTPPGPDATPIY